MAGIVIADRLTGAQQAARLRIVVECLGVRERRKKLGIIGKAAAGGVSSVFQFVLSEKRILLRQPSS
jgi:hypothetical protein